MLSSSLFHVFNLMFPPNVWSRCVWKPLNEIVILLKVINVIGQISLKPNDCPVLWLPFCGRLCLTVTDPPSFSQPFCALSRPPFLIHPHPSALPLSIIVSGSRGSSRVAVCRRLKIQDKGKQKARSGSWETWRGVEGGRSVWVSQECMLSSGFFTRRGMTDTLFIGFCSCHQMGLVCPSLWCYLLGRHITFYNTQKTQNKLLN